MTPKLRKKYLLRFFSIVASFFIWLYVVSSAEVELSKNIPIQIELPKGYAIANLVEKEASFRFKGPGLFVREFIELEKVIKIKRDNYYKKGKTNFNIRLDRFPIKLPLGVELLSLEPRILNLSIEKKITKKVKVSPFFTKNIEDKYVITNIQVKPEFVNVTGPKSIVNVIDTIETKPIDGENLITNKSLLADLAFVDQRVIVEAKNVNVSYVLESKLLDFTYNRIPIIFQSAYIIKNASFREASVTIRGDRLLLESLAADQLKVLAEINKNQFSKNNGPSQKNVGQVELKISLPEGLEVVKMEPSTIEVEWE